MGKRIMDTCNVVCIFNIQYLSAPCAGCTLGTNCPMQHCQTVTKYWLVCGGGGRGWGGNQDDIVIIMYQ